MNASQSPFRSAAVFLLISAALHLFAWLPGGYSADARQLIPFGLLYALLALGLGFGWRWIGYIVFLAAIVGGIYTLGFVWSLSTVPGWWYVAIIASNWLSAALLFVALWKGPVITSTQ